MMGMGDTSDEAAAQPDAHQAQESETPDVAAPAARPPLEIAPFGVRVRQWRKRIGMSQAELARRLNYSRQYLCAIESGQAPAHRHIRQLIVRTLLDAYQQAAAETADQQRLDG